MADRTRRHGTAYSYRQGCRCGGCTQAKRDEVRRFRASLDERLTAGVVKHGTAAVYNRRCRCADCGKAGRREWLLSKYSITPEQYAELLEAQGGRCAICGGEPGERALAVDHDHSCCPGKGSCGRCVRGLLCHDCNGALGLLRDNPATAMAAATYLQLKT
jgi:hypothetical protein